MTERLLSLTQLDGPVVVTGASGFIGARLCQYLLDHGAKVVAFTGPTGPEWRVPDVPQLTRLRVDLCAREQTMELLQRLQPAAIVNCAAYGAYPSQKEAARIYEVNFTAVRHLLDAARSLPNLRAFVQAGSSSEYGFNCDGPSESSQTVPDSDYAVSKVAASALVQLYGKKHGVPAWSFRLYSVFGPLEDASRLIPTLVLRAREGTLPPLVNPRISRDFVFVDDVCGAFEQLLLRAPEVPRGEIFNIGTGRSTTLEQAVAAVRETFAVSAEPQWGSMPDRAWDHPNWRANPAKAEALFGWKATTSFADGLRRTRRFFDEFPALTELALRHAVVPTKP